MNGGVGREPQEVVVGQKTSGHAEAVRHEGFEDTQPAQRPDFSAEAGRGVRHAGLGSHATLLGAVEMEQTEVEEVAVVVLEVAPSGPRPAVQHLAVQVDPMERIGGKQRLTVDVVSLHRYSSGSNRLERGAARGTGDVRFPRLVPELKSCWSSAKVEPPCSSVSMEAAVLEPHTATVGVGLIVESRGDGVLVEAPTRNP